ncbi:MAG: tetratricopeptide repeat protein [Myxococcales bacterium]|nr:MAG: tetratricopeptide repeat protein [Myxococcales bacterium]
MLFKLALCTIFVISCAKPQQSSIYRHVGGERRAGPLVSETAYAAYLQGEIFFSKGYYERSIESFRKCLREGARDPYVLSRLAEVLYENKEQDEAEDLVEDSLEDFPNSEALWIVSARFSEKKGEFYRAVASYIQAQRSAQGDSAVALALSRTLRDHGLRQRADAVLEEHVRSETTVNLGELRLLLEGAVELGDVQEASAASERMLDVAPARADEVREVAHQAFEKKHFAIAVALLEQVSRDAADEVLRIEALIGAGNMKRALAILSTSSPDRMGGEIPMARLFLELEKPARCIELADVAVASEKNVSEAHWLKGRCLIMLGQEGQSAFQFAQVAPGSTSFASARIELATILERKGMKEQALLLLFEAIEQNPEKAFDLRVLLASMYAEDSRFQEALALFEQPPDLLHRIHRAFLLEYAGAFDDALQIFLSATEAQLKELPPRYSYRSRAEQLWNRELQAQAIALLSVRLEQAPEDYAVRLRLLEFLQMAEQQQAFFKLYEQSKTMDFPHALSKRFTRLLPEETPSLDE